MRAIPSAVQTQRETRSGTITHHLIWITARNRSTGADETLGLWTGDIEQDFTINGVTRTYSAAGAVLGIEPIRFAVGLNVIYHSITLSPFTDAVQAALREYDARLAPIEIHQVAYDPETMTVLADPFQIVDGEINEMPEDFPPEGGEGSITVSIASAARRFTVSPALFKSDAALRKRSATDDFRKYVDVQGAIKVAWGERLERVGGGGSSSYTPPSGPAGGV